MAAGVVPAGQGGVGWAPEMGQAWGPRLVAPGRPPSVLPELVLL